ncbi:hypothetical protein SAMN05216268_126111 [Streptomyces yunnanensis]|uniref:Uncharacterized protein n=1 Tax=Streptomyces yunnanensis TaxID=156453 RepID=A0A9X8QZK7_9ACTN|nr:hypothetical protein SAMN05216268_126111 [Streptomyces yunnanensis]
MVLCTRARDIRTEGLQDSETCKRNHAETGKESYATMAIGARIRMSRLLERHMRRCLECGR